MTEKVDFDEIITVEKDNGKTKVSVKKSEGKIKYKSMVKKPKETPKVYVKEKDVKPAEIKGEQAVKSVIEAALFITPNPLKLNELARLAGISSLGYLKDILEKLQKDYNGRGIEITATRDGWQMQVKPEYLSHVSNLTPYSDLSEGCKRTLALVVYKEPVTQAEIIRIQGNKAYTYIKQLKRRGLIRAEKKGRSRVIKLTQEFERYFGEEKEKIKEQLKI